MNGQNENELAVLGAAILSPPTLDIASGIITEADFASPELGRAFAVMCDMHGSGQPVGDVVVLMTNLKSAGLLGAVGGAAAIGQWTVACGAAQHAGRYAAAVRAASHLRRLKALSMELGQRAGAADADPAELAGWLESQLTAFHHQGGEAPQTIGELMAEAVAEIRRTKAEGIQPGLPTGIDAVDDAMRLHRGELIILAARPSIGKSSLGAQIAAHNAALGTPAMFISLEMSGRDLAVRQLAAAAGREVSALRGGWVADETVAELDRAAQAAADLPLHVLSMRGATIEKIRSAAKLQRSTGGLGLLMVDYIGLIRSSDSRKPRWEAVAQISCELKSLAMELNVPVVVLCQLNRESEGQPPTLGHLRDSGAIEQDADIVALLHRDNRGEEKAELNIAKNRNGRCGVINLEFDCATTTFRSPQVSDSYEYFA